MGGYKSSNFSFRLFSEESSEPREHTFFLFFFFCKGRQVPRDVFAHDVGFAVSQYRLPSHELKAMMMDISTHCLLLFLVWTCLLNSYTGNIFLFAQRYLPNIQHAILKGKRLKMSKKSLSSKDCNFPVFLLTVLQKVNKDDNI